MGAFAVWAWAAAAVAASPGGVFTTVEEARALHAAGSARFVWADGAAEFEEGHVPGSVVATARTLHLLDDVRSCGGLPMCEARAAEVLSALGLDGTSPVVVYDGGRGVGASGTWFFLELYGHVNARILDGGLAAWRAAGLPVEQGPAAKVERTRFVPRVRWDLLATHDDG